MQTNPSTETLPSRHRPLTYKAGQSVQGTDLGHRQNVQSSLPSKIQQTTHALAQLDRAQIDVDMTCCRGAPYLKPAC